MVDGINNINPAGGISPSSVTPSDNKLSTPDPNAVNAMQNQLNGADPAAVAANNTPVSGKPGISSADMKLFMDEVNKFCIQQGIQTTPKATGD